MLSAVFAFLNVFKEGVQPLPRETSSRDMRKHKNWEQLKPFSRWQECARDGVRHQRELTGIPVGIGWPAAVLSSNPEESKNK